MWISDIDSKSNRKISWHISSFQPNEGNSNLKPYSGVGALETLSVGTETEETVKKLRIAGR